MTDEHLHRSIRALSRFGYVVALVMFSLSALLVLVPPPEFFITPAALLPIMAFAVLVAAIARSLRKLQPWARTASIALSFIGLLVVPLGTLLCGPFLYVLLKSKHLFAAHNQTRNALPADTDRLAA